MQCHTSIYIYIHAHTHPTNSQIHVHTLQACAQWDKAIEVAEKHDRIHLKATHYAHAQVCP